MKRISRSLLIAIAATGLLAAPGFAQLPGASTGSSSSSTAKPLSSSERKFVKDAGEQLLAVTHLVELTRHAKDAPGSEELHKLNAKINADCGKIWGELGTVAQSRKADLPKTDVSGNEKALLAKLRKTEGDKFDKAFLKALDKETKKMAQVFEAGEKSVQDPELKTVITNWTPKIKGYAEEVAAAEDAASKKK